MQTDPETIDSLWFWLYVAAGVPVAWLYLRQQKMQKPYSTIPLRQAKSIVIFTLATMWPLLLLSMGLSYLQQKPRRVRSQPPPTNESPSSAHE